MFTVGTVVTAFACPINLKSLSIIENEKHFLCKCIFDNTVFHKKPSAINLTCKCVEYVGSSYMAVHS